VQASNLPGVVGDANVPVTVTFPELLSGVWYVTKQSRLEPAVSWITFGKLYGVRLSDGANVVIFAFVVQPEGQ
jgi:hypothetical protein